MVEGTTACSMTMRESQRNKQSKKHVSFNPLIFKMTNTTVLYTTECVRLSMC